MTIWDSSILAPHGPIGQSEKQMLMNATVIMLAVIVPVIIATLSFAWWFRSGNRAARRRPTWAYSGRIEFVTWTIPMLVVMFLGGICWIGAHDLDPPRPLAGADPLTVEVISLDWKWLFIYPEEGVAAVNQLTIPVGRPVRFRLTSATVMNSFFIPQLGSQIYTMAGMVTQLNLRADDAGSFQGLSAQFSGDGFSDMRFETHAISVGEFADWVAKVRAQGPVLDAAAYVTLAHPSERLAPNTYADVQPGLFDAVVHRSGAVVPGDL
jgi:cytochrome o ubiquinol oxidase subunit II